jgi:hypothetical protein
MFCGIYHTISMNQPAHTQSTPTARKKSWTLPDLVNLCGVIIALLGLTVPAAYHVYQTHFLAPQAAIDAPVNGEIFPTNRIAIRGTAGHVPADSDLWLSASGPSDEVYPIAELQVSSGQWSVTEKQACFRIGPGSQRIDVWISPDTNDGPFVAYMQKNNSFGFSSVPVGFIKLSQVNINVRHPLNNC